QGPVVEGVATRILGSIIGLDGKIPGLDVQCVLLDTFSVQPDPVPWLVVIGHPAGAVGTGDLGMGVGVLMQRSVDLAVADGVVGEVLFQVAGSGYVVFLPRK